MKKRFITMIFLIVLAVPLAADDSDTPEIPFWTEFSVYALPYISKKPVNGLYYLFCIAGPPCRVMFILKHPTRQGLAELLKKLALEVEELTEKKAKCVDALDLEGAVEFNITTTPGGKTVLYSLSPFDPTAVMVHSPTRVSYVHMKYPTVSPDDYTTIADLEMIK